MPTEKSYNQLLASPNLHQHAKNQFIPPAHFEIQSILIISHDQTGHTHFWHAQLKKFQSTFKLRKIIPACKKIS